MNYTAQYAPSVYAPSVYTPSVIETIQLAATVAVNPNPDNEPERTVSEAYHASGLQVGTFTRKVLSGIKTYYDLDELIPNRSVVLPENMKRLSDDDRLRRVAYYRNILIRSVIEAMI